MIGCDYIITVIVVLLISTLLCSKKPKTVLVNDHDMPAHGTSEYISLIN